MKIINSVASWIIKKRIHQIELFMKYPNEVQGELFDKLISTAKDTEWGRRYEYSSIKTITDYKNRVPVKNYDGFQKDILRIKQGAQNVLWPTEIKWFAKSSGTTADRSKFIPISKEALEDCHYKGGKDMLSIYFNLFEESQLFTGKGVVLGGSSEVNQFSKNSYYGDLSSIIIKNLPMWAEFVRIPDLETTLLPDWEEKIEKIAQSAKNENVTNLSGVPSWNLVLLNRILELTGKENMMEIWPNFELYVHGGVSFHPYRDQYKRLFPSDAVQYLETYNASEGFFGIQDDLSKYGEMLLMLDYGIFYEFVPMDELGKDFPDTCSLDDVEIGKNYALVISSNAGLWRYLIGDTVQFTSKAPYRIKVSGRTKYFINAFGEELIADNAEKALAIACEKTKATVNEYTAAPIYMNKEGKGSHEWVIEFVNEPESREYFVEILDNALKSVNSDYEAKRYKDMALQLPKVHFVGEGTFYNWLKNKGKLGGQHKVPRLSNDRKNLESVLESI